MKCYNVMFIKWHIGEMLYAVLVTLHANEML